MSPSAFATVLGPVTGSTASAKGGRAEVRPVGDDADFAAALNDAAAIEAPARSAPAISPKGEPAASVSEGDETETGAIASEGLVTVPEAAPALPILVLPTPVPESAAALVPIPAEAGTERAEAAVPASATPQDETPASVPAAGKPPEGSGEGPVIDSDTADDRTWTNERDSDTEAPTGKGADKAAVDKAAQAIADRFVADQKVVAPQASDRAREVAALNSAVLTPARPAKVVAPAEPAPAPIEAVETSAEGDQAAVAPVADTPVEPVRVRDVIDRAATRAASGGKASEAEPTAPVTPRSADQSATPPTSAKPSSSPVEAATSPIAPLVSAEEPTTSSPAPAAQAQTEARAVEAAQTPGLSTLSRASVETTAQIAAQIVKRLEGRSTRFEMALTPEGLGRVDISLDIEADGALRATLAFDNPVAATDLRGRADELRRQLLDAGFTLAEDALSFADRDPAAGQGSGFDRSSDRHNARAFGAATRLSVEADLSAQPPRWINLSLTPAGVDMKV